MERSTDDATVERLVEVFKALADPARLRILGAIAEGPLTGKNLSERLGLTPPTISHHMSKLVGARLVSVTPDAQRRLYTLDGETLRGLSRDVADRDRGDGKERDGETARRQDGKERDGGKVIKDFFKGTRLKQIPAQRKKRVVVLQHLLGRFEPNRDYAEREVNAILKEAHDDVATLRRELVDYGFMTREGGVYRVAQSLRKRSARVAQEISGDEHRWLRALLSGATNRALTPDRP